MSGNLHAPPQEAETSDWRLEIRDWRLVPYDWRLVACPDFGADQRLEIGSLRLLIGGVFPA